VEHRLSRVRYLSLKTFAYGEFDFYRNLPRRKTAPRGN
jgi:hypothetical protein